MHIIFYSGNELFALTDHDVAEVLPLARLATPPCMPMAMAGFLDLGGELLTVLNLNRLLEIEAAPPLLYNHLLRLRETFGALALMVDRVIAVTGIEPDQIRPVDRRETFRGCVTSEIVGHTQPVHLLSPAVLLSQYEKERLQTFRDTEMRRKMEFGGEA